MNHPAQELRPAHGRRVDVDADDEDGDAAPYLRIAARSAATAGGPHESYLRLGGYIPSEETVLLPPTAGAATDADRIASTARVTTSTTRATDYASSEAYAQAQNPGSPTTSKRAVAVTTSRPATPSGAGLLFHSDQDLLVRIAGAAYLSYGRGHGTAVLGGDVELDIPGGQYTLNAQNGIRLTAGTTAAPADIALTAYNTISQTSLGPSDSVTYGDSTAETHGNSRGVTWGDGNTEVHGTVTSLFFGASRSWAFDNDVTGKLANSLLLFVGTTTSIILGASISAVIGNMSYVYLASYAELYAGAFVSVKFGPVLVMKDFGAEFSGIAVDWAKAKVAAVQARLAKTEINLPVTDAEVSAVQIDVDQAAVRSRSNSVTVDTCGIHVKL